MVYLPRIFDGGNFFMAYIYVRFNGGLSYTHLSPREGPRCAQLRGAVLAGHLSLFGVRNAAEEFGLRDSEAPWVRWMFCFSNVKDAGKKSMMFFFWLFGSMWIYDGSWCFFFISWGFLFFLGGGVERIGANLFVVWWGGRHFFLNCQVGLWTCE